MQESEDYKSFIGKKKKKKKNKTNEKTSGRETLNESGTKTTEVYN